jgi:hypothetical protein
MLTRSMSLLAMCSLATGCRGGNLFAIVVVIAIIVAASIRNGISLSRRKCPYCGHAGGTPQLHEKGFVDCVTCDHCGKEI